MTSRLLCGLVNAKQGTSTCQDLSRNSGDLLAEGTKSQESRIDSLTSASVHLVYMSTKRYLERSGAEEGLVKSGPRYC